jgi:hypothetical protein
MYDSLLSSIARATVAAYPNPQVMGDRSEIAALVLVEDELPERSHPVLHAGDEHEVVDVSEDDKGASRPRPEVCPTRY